MTMEAAMYNTRGRPIIFTPERLEQINNLVERGHSREQIAEIIGCTPGSLAVTCSRLGISLRRPKPAPGTLSAAAVRVVPLCTADPPKTNGGPPPDGPKPAAPEPAEPETVTVELRIEYKGRARQYKIPMSSETMTQLLLDAEVRGLTFAELLAQLLTAYVKKD